MIGAVRPYLFILLFFVLFFVSFAGCVPNATPRSSDLVIDDMEDQTRFISSSDTYALWYVYGDNTAGAQIKPVPSSPFTMEPIPGGRYASKYAMRMSGAGFSDWGAGMGFDLEYGDATDSGPAPKVAVDARAYAGIRFWARVGQASTTSLQFMIVAGSCPPGDDAGAVLASDECAVRYPKNLALTTDWVRYDIGFSELTLNPGHLPLPRDQIYSVLFNVPASTTFDLWVDDISWIPTAPVP